MPAPGGLRSEPGQTEHLSSEAPDREMGTPSTQPTPQQTALGDLLPDSVATPRVEQLFTLFLVSQPQGPTTGAALIRWPGLPLRFQSSMVR